MPEDLKVSQIGSSPLPLPFSGLHSPGVRKHCQIIFACYFRKSSIKEGCSNQKNSNVKQTDKLGPKAVQSFVILPQGYRKTGIPDERMFGGDTLPDHEVRKPEAETYCFMTELFDWRTIVSRRMVFGVGRLTENRLVNDRVGTTFTASE